MDREIVALRDDVDDMLEVTKVEIRVDALCIEVESEIDEVDIAGTFAVSEQTALDSVTTSEKSKFGGSDSSTCPRASVLSAFLNCNGRHKPLSL